MATIKLNKTLIIVIAVSGLVGCIIVLLLILRCCRRPKSPPLPPIQPLAHHREKESNYLLHPRIPRDSAGLNQLGPCGSDVSLLKPSRKPSFHTDESHSTPSCSHYSFSPSTPSNVTHQSSPLLVESRSEEPASAARQYVPTTRQARSASRTRVKSTRSRTNSAGSTHSPPTHASTRSPNTIHGAPHSSLSNVQIVLPAPLAPQLQNHIVINPAVASYEDLVERGGIADGWTTAPGRVTSRRPTAGQDLLTQYISRGRKTSSSPGHRYHRSLDITGQSRQPELQTQFRGRASSHRAIQPPRATLQKPRNREAGRSSSEEGGRSSSNVNANLRSRSRPLSHSNQSPNNAPNVPFPQSVSHSLHPYTPSSSADTLTNHSTYNGLSPPPVPPLPQLSRNSLARAEHASSRRFNSATDNKGPGGTST